MPSVLPAAVMAELWLVLACMMLWPLTEGELRAGRGAELNQEGVSALEAAVATAKRRAMGEVAGAAARRGGGGGGRGGGPGGGGGGGGRGGWGGGGGGGGVKGGPPGGESRGGEGGRQSNKSGGGWAGCDEKIEGLTGIGVDLTVARQFESG